MIATLSAGALTFAATNIQKKLATIMILMEILNHIAKRCPREVALVWKVKRSVALVRFHLIPGKKVQIVAHICGLPPLLWSQTDLQNNVAGWCINILTDACCDATTEEICYEVDSTGEYKTSCKAIADGGCPCWEGWEKCGQGKLLRYGCIEKLCLLVAHIFGLPPLLWTQTDLKNNVTGWCLYIESEVCCDETTEETCYEVDSFTLEYKTYCKAIADGGCPCWEGSERCGAGEVYDV